LAILAFALAGCGGGADTSTSTEVAAPANEKQADPASKQAKAMVSEKQISAAKPGSAERTVLEWWREVQANDPEQALALYLNPPALPDLAGQFNLVSPHLLGAVKVVSVDAESDPAVAKVRWKQPNGDVRVVSLRLKQDGGAWKLVDTRFLDEMVVELQAAGAGS
jgi:hypothetical protein